MSFQLKEIDGLEILTLQDNYVDMVSGDGTAVVRRALPLKGLEIKNSILAEHGFSALVTTIADGARRSLLFDFGFSAEGAAANAQALGANLSSVEVMALSHGHLDHVGGLKKMMELIGRTGVDLVLHPSAFKNPRYIKMSEELKLLFPAFTKDKAEAAGARPVETSEPRMLLDGAALFLGEIPRNTEFEKGMPNVFTEVDGREVWDPIEDDTALAFHVKGKGLVVLSGCSHSGIVNTTLYARELTGVDKVYTVMGGFHLTGPAFVDTIKPTIEGLKALDPTYVIPTHCTGRKAVNAFEREMPDRFLLNMSGTTIAL